MKRTGILLLAAGVLGGGLLGCDTLDPAQKVQQVGSYQRVDLLCTLLKEGAKARKQPFTPDEVQSIIGHIQDGKDSWGNKILFVPSKDDAQSSYLLISLGSDGKLDEADADAYFSAPVREVKGKFASDLVCRNGTMITSMGE